MLTPYGSDIIAKFFVEFTDAQKFQGLMTNVTVVDSTVGQPLCLGDCLLIGFGVNEIAVRVKRMGQAILTDVRTLCVAYAVTLIHCLMGCRLLCR